MISAPLLLLVFLAQYTVQAPAENVTEKPQPVSNNTIATVLPKTIVKSATEEVKAVVPEKKKETNVRKAVAETATTLATIVEETTTGDKDEEEQMEQEEEQKPLIAEEEGTVEQSEPVVKEASKTPSAQTRIDTLAEPEDSNFLVFLLVGVLLVVCIYLLQHNKKKLLGLMFEGRSSRRNVRYRRLSQRDDLEQFKDDIIY